MSSAGVPEPGRSADGQVDDADRVARVVERVEHRAADAALRVVVLGDDEPVAGRGRGLEQRLGVDRLDRVQVHDPGARCRRGRARRRRPGSCAGSRRRRSASPGRPGWTGRPSSRRSGTPRPVRTAPGTRRGWCACRRCRCVRPSAPPGWRCSSRRSGTAPWSRARPASWPGPPGPSGTGRPRRSRRPRASRTAGCSPGRWPTSG